MSGLEKAVWLTLCQVFLLKEAVTEFANRASEKQRKQGSHTGQMLVFIQTSPFRQQDKQYSPPRWYRCADPPTTAEPSAMLHSWAVSTSTNWVTDIC